jgi:hypothetical protein
MSSTSIPKRQRVFGPHKSPNTRAKLYFFVELDFVRKPLECQFPNTSYVETCMEPFVAIEPRNNALIAGNHNEASGTS